MVQALCRQNGTGPYSGSGTTKAKLTPPSSFLPRPTFPRGPAASSYAHRRRQTEPPGGFSKHRGLTAARAIGMATNSVMALTRLISDVPHHIAICEGTPESLTCHARIVIVSVRLASARGPDGKNADVLAILATRPVSSNIIWVCRTCEVRRASRFDPLLV